MSWKKTRDEWVWTHQKISETFYVLTLTMIVTLSRGCPEPPISIVPKVTWSGHFEGQIVPSSLSRNWQPASQLACSCIEDQRTSRMPRLDFNIDEATLLKAYKISSLNPSYVCRVLMVHTLSNSFQEVGRNRLWFRRGYYRRFCSDVSIRW